MPTISMFYGIAIRMYFAPDEHNPPHFHAYYGEHQASFSEDQSCITASQVSEQSTDTD